MKGVSPDEIDDYAAGHLDEGITWLSSRKGAQAPRPDAHDVRP